MHVCCPCAMTVGIYDAYSMINGIFKALRLSTPQQFENPRFKPSVATLLPPSNLSFPTATVTSLIFYFLQLL